MLNERSKPLISKARLAIAPSLSFMPGLQPAAKNNSAAPRVLAAYLSKQVALPAGTFAKLEATQKEAEAAMTLGGSRKADERNILRADGGFVVRKPAPAAVSLTVVPNLDAATLVCHYRFTSTDGLPPREDRVNVMFVGVGTETLQMKHHGTGQVFATAEGLSEFLLVPVLTGRPR